MREDDFVYSKSWLAGARKDLKMKTVFTTGEAAKICKVSQQTIIRCFDNGQLKGFRVPGSRFRRIPRESLYKFMKDNGIPTDALESGKRKVLLVDDDTELLELMNKVIEDDGRFEVRIATNGFDAGMMVKEYRPDVIVLDVMLPDINGNLVSLSDFGPQFWREKRQSLDSQKSNSGSFLAQAVRSACLARWASLRRWKWCWRVA